MIEIKNVSYTYDDAMQPSLRNVSLTVKDGEYLAIVGHNGSGKSTLAKHLNGLLLPDEGKVTVDGIDTADADRLLELRRRVGMVFQNPDNQLVTTIVEEDVAFGPENLGVPSEEIRRRVADVLGLVGMSDYAQGASHALSGGQKQRIAIAGMLAMQPEVLVLDEATAMLDPAGRAEVLAIVKELHEKKGLTVIMITQYMEEIAGCDRVIVMSGGTVRAEGTPKEIFLESGLLAECGLDVPETVKLVNELREAGLDIGETPVTADETVDAICRSFLKN